MIGRLKAEAYDVFGWDPKLSYSQKCFSNGFYKLEHNLEIISIVKSINKLKAMMGLLIGDNKKILHDAQKLFVNHSTIMCD